jgi:hypothetical protein
VLALGLRHFRAERQKFGHRDFQRLEPSLESNDAIANSQFVGRFVDFKSSKNDHDFCTAEVCGHSSIFRYGIAALGNDCLA